MATFFKIVFTIHGLPQSFVLLYSIIHKESGATSSVQLYSCDSHGTLLPSLDLKKGGLESSVQRLISLYGKTKKNISFSCLTIFSFLFFQIFAKIIISRAFLNKSLDFWICFRIFWILKQMFLYCFGPFLMFYCYFVKLLLNFQTGI